MSAQTLLEQLLKSGLDMVQARAPSARPPGPASSAPAGRSDGGVHWGSFAGGAASGGALGLLLGSKRGRKVGKQVLKVGSVAALGALAYAAYTRWQASSQGPAGQPAPVPAGPTAAADPPVHLLPAPAAEHHARAMLQAMIGAAKADGHLDDRERELLEAELRRLEADPTLRGWLDTQLRQPVDPAEVARAASSPQLAAEMYLASLLIADETSWMERAYLDELARQMQLPASLKADLEAQAAAV